MTVTPDRLRDLVADPQPAAVGREHILVLGAGMAGLAAAFACGFLAVLLGGVLVGLALSFTEEHFFNVAVAVILAHLPVAVVEGVVTALCVGFLRRVQPGLLPGRPPAEVP
mgnify:CR=1 FL=1